jgi:pyruvate dehydrogenase E2 component (dihydrolipoamide acetyltransferase)
MATRIVMSKLSPTMEEGRVLRWVKSEGDTVDSGDVVVEVETDKATMEVEAMGSGLLRKILVGDGTTVPTGTVLGVIASEDEDISSILAEAESFATAASRTDGCQRARRFGGPTKPGPARASSDGGRG